MSGLKPNELALTEQLMEKGRFYEALQTIESLEKNKYLTSREKLSLLLFKCTCLNRLRLDQKKVIKYAEEAFQESQKLGESLQSVDALVEMASTLTWLTKCNEALDVISKGEDLLKIIIRESPKEITKREASLAFARGVTYRDKKNYDRGLEHFKKSLALFEKLDIKQEIARTLFSIGNIHLHKGDLDDAREYYQRGLTVAEEDGNNHYIIEGLFSLGWVSQIKSELKKALEYGEKGLVLAEKINHKYLIIQCLKIFAVNYSYKGNFDRSIEFHKQKMKVAQEINDKLHIIGSLTQIGLNYRYKGDFDNALLHLEECLELYDEDAERGGVSLIRIILGNLFELFTDKGDYEQARLYYQKMDKRVVSEYDKLSLRLYNAQLLKSSQRAYDRGKAEEILKQVVDDGINYFDVTQMALISLCDLLLVELGVTSDLEVLGVLQSYITQLLEFAEKSRSYFLLGESYLLQAKLSLVTLEIKKARRLLTQSQQIAERWGYTQLAKKISSEYDNLLEHLSEWEKLKKSNAPLTERMKLARVEDQMKGIVRDRTKLTARITEEKISIHEERKVCLVCKGEVERFNIYICPECNVIYCHKCAKALTDLENLCWSCNTPIDPSKPISPYKKEEGIKISPKKDVETQNK